jgi:serine/threonine protein kinase, bacterial
LARIANILTVAGQDAVGGTPFGRYRLVELLGRGGMGEVWRAYDTETDRIVAIKLLPPHFLDNEEFKRRFRREAHAAARLHTPYVVPIHNYGEIDGRLYVDMRLVEGHDLDAVLADGPLDPARAVRIIEQVAMALHAAHEVGLLHRDVKPSNILLDRNDFAYLIDFGIARAAEETRMTKSGYPPGTFQYIAPERLGTRAEEDARADIYSLACVLYECLTGRPPFAAETMAGQVAAHLNTPPPQPSATQPDLPKQIDEVIATGMAKDPDNRYATTVELADAAHQALSAPAQHRADTTLASTQTATLPNADLAATLAAPTPRPPAIASTETGAPAKLPARPRLVALPFTGLNGPSDVAVDTAGNVYVTDFDNDRVLKLPAGSNTEVELPFTGLDSPEGVAVDSAGNVYVADYGNDRVLELPAGSNTQVELPFTGLDSPEGVAVDADGYIYVADFYNDRVLELPAGSNTPVELPFTRPNGVAVDSAGDIYVTDYTNNRVLKLPAGSNTPIKLPFTGLDSPNGVAIDITGNVYVINRYDNRVLKLPAGSNTQVELPFTDLTDPEGVAVDITGNVYVADYGNNRVLKLAAG